MYRFHLDDKCQNWGSGYQVHPWVRIFKKFGHPPIIRYLRLPFFRSPFILVVVREYNLLIDFAGSLELPDGITWDKSQATYYCTCCKIKLSHHHISKMTAANVQDTVVKGEIIMITQNGKYTKNEWFIFG